MKNELKLSLAETDSLFLPDTIRRKAKQVFALAEKGESFFAYHRGRLAPTVDYVLAVIRRNYPDLNIPFHSRWGHFRVGGADRVAQLNNSLRGLEPMERARVKLDLVIPSVLLDAGAGGAWKFKERHSGQSFQRSEGLGVASWHLFLSRAMSSDGKSLRADMGGLNRITLENLAQAFQVSDSNPLVGLEGRLQLLHNLAKALRNQKFFRDNRPGNILDHLTEKYGQKIPAAGILQAVLNCLGSIWPGRLSANGKNLGDVWQHSKVSLVPFHKLSQWMTYSLIEPIREAGIAVYGVEQLTGLAEYRNGGLMIDSGLISLRDSALQQKAWEPGSDLVIEWRALTIYLLDQLGVEIRESLGQSEEDMPLAKVLEGGTWWAGRFLAREKRRSGEPPLTIESDGTVF